MLKMNTFRNAQFSVRALTGVIILLHALLRIVFIDEYINFVLLNYSEVVQSQTVLIIVASLIPFLEFFTGLLLIFKVAVKRSVLAGISISVIMVVFILLGQIYLLLIYHAIIFALLVLVGESYMRQKNNKNHLFK